MNDKCFICERIALWQAGENPYVIAEFKHSIFVVGDHQYFPGYSLILYKQHVREMLDLPPQIQTELFEEVMRGTRALVETFHPWKMNHASYGNAQPHIHWHLIPRYADDPNRLKPPFQMASEFHHRIIDSDEAAAVAARIRANLD